MAEEELGIPIIPTEQPAKKSKKIIYILLTFFLILILGSGFIYFKAWKNKKGKVSLQPVLSNSARNIISNRVISPEDSKLLPDAFPKEYIHVSYSHITAIENFPSQNGKPYAVKLLVFESREKSYSDAIEYYTQKGWNVLESKNKDTKSLNYSFSAKKEKTYLNLFFSPAGNNACEIALTVIEGK